MPEYHVLRKDREIVVPDEIMDIVRRQAILTIGMAWEGVPYLVTVNYAYDARRKAFYFHSARAGKKVDYLEANPSVWCQILEDRGYIAGTCDWSYRSVHFPGTAQFVRDAEEPGPPPPPAWGGGRGLGGKPLFTPGGSRGIGKTIGLRAARDRANVVIAAKT